MLLASCLNRGSLRQPFRIEFLHPDTQGLLTHFEFGSNLRGIGFIDTSIDYGSSEVAGMTLRRESWPAFQPI